MGGHCKGTRSFQLLLHIQRCDTESAFGGFLLSGTTDRHITQPAHLILRKSDQRVKGEVGKVTEGQLQGDTDDTK